MLYVVPTPIGNLEDITLRALRVLREADVILAEDTRTSKRLLDHFEIIKPLKSFHAHNEHTILRGLVEQLKGGAKMALISDAGTPAISDPGFLLVRECVREGVKVEALPGATAFVPALVASGLPCNMFHFEGFLPHKKGRQTRLKYLSSLENTFILYESPHRLVKCLEELIVTLWRRTVGLCLSGTDKNARRSQNSPPQYFTHLLPDRRDYKRRNCYRCCRFITTIIRYQLFTIHY